MDVDRSASSVVEMSYIRARDPSILDWNLPALAEANMSEQNKEEFLRVYLRIKGGCDFGNLYEIRNDVLVCRAPPGSNILRHVKEGDLVQKLYTFSKIFQPDAGQADIFNRVVKKKVLDFINGSNCTLMTYGASGSGRTFTVIGTSDEPGLIPRSLEYLFRTIPNISENPLVKPLQTGEVERLDSRGSRMEQRFCQNLLNASSLMDKTQHTKTYIEMQQRLSSEPVGLLEDHAGVTVGIWVSFAEIYNEQIFDLLQPDPPRGKPRPELELVGSARGGTYIKNLTNIYVASGLEAYQVLQYGIHNLNYASTNINSHSSRSHSIFTVKLIQLSHKDGGVFVSNFNFCDLAGSERSKKTLNVGDRLKESNNINSSLSVLGRCISIITNSQKQHDNKLVPFRGSKLTQLFQRALAGFEDIDIIVNISPLREMFDESQHVLMFAAIAKDVKVDRRVEVVKSAKNNRFSQFRQNTSLDVDNELSEKERLRNAVSSLRHEMEVQKIDMQTDAQSNLENVHEGYRQTIDDIERGHKERIKDLQNFLKSDYEDKINKIKVRYAEMLSEQNDVIIVDSSTDEEDDVNENIAIQTLSQIQLKEREDKIKELNQTIMIYKQQLAAETMNNKNAKNILNETVNDGVLVCEQLEKDCREKDNEIFLLRENIDQLEMENAILRRNLIEAHSSAKEEDEENVPVLNEDVPEPIDEENVPVLNEDVPEPIDEENVPVSNEDVGEPIDEENVSVSNEDVCEPIDEENVSVSNEDVCEPIDEENVSVSY